MIISKLNRIFQKLNCSMLFRTSVGIKPVRKLMYSHNLNLDLVKEREPVNTDQIISFPDFLKDTHTTLGQPVHAWPHYELIECLDQKRRLEDSDYVNRCLRGTLDFRSKMKVSIERLKETYQEQIRRMERGETF